MRRAILPLLALLMSVATPALAEPNAQLVRSVQQRLDRLGFEDVDAGTLSTAQIAALHLQLGSNDLVGSPRYTEARQKVKVILSWTPEYEQRY